ncbi:trihelix transcription factor GTL1-like [Zingiber officinale]|uniref:trihelix transcription factor GTL1-like n=1 Tax=Zingiber officinale TaxID=94328 RepID=UPI001C4BAAB9|nr:trihelix transcription factor GTL1-like [Zingiber officinale]
MQQQAPPGPPRAAAAADGAPQFPTLAPFPSCLPPPAEAVSPISSRAPDSGMVNFDAAGYAIDEEALAGGAPGNRWPRQETLALLKIRSEMDAAFREATFKGPLWEEVSRKLAELGYKRSSKKCKEKFENVHKYYKRTKEGRAGRQDGKAYRFFSQLEALHNNAAAAAPTGHVSFRMQPQPVSSVSVPLLGPQQTVLASAPAGPVGIDGFAWNNSSSSSSGPESDDEDTEDDGVEGEGRKRKRRGGSRKMMAFFEGLMKRVTVRQDEMQRRFLEAIEKREQERMIREEAWRRQEMARFGREQELLAQERALAASRDAAVIAYLQKITSVAQTTSPPPPLVSAVALATIPISVTETLPPTPQPIPQLQPTPSKKKPAPPAEEGGVGSLEPPLSSSRWPKAEVHALIDLRSRLEVRYQEAGPKGLLWEEISAGMRRLGYDRSSKRCKEKWENINKYFKKVKDGNKRRPEDAKTCPYFHQLEALYRRKHHGEAGVMAFPPPAPPPPPAAETAGGNSQPLLPTNNNEGTLRKAEEEAVKDLMEQTQRQSLDLDEYDSENMEQDDEEDVDDEDDDEDSKMQYKIQFQQHNVSGPGGSTSTAAPPPSAPGSFLAMVQ